MRCWRRQGRRILRGAPHPGVVPSLYVHPHPHPGRGTHRSSTRARPPGWAPPERVRARADSFEGFVSHPQVSNGAKSNDTSWLHADQTNGQARTLDNGEWSMPTYHESTYHVRYESIAPTYSALFRFEILYAAYNAAYLNIATLIRYLVRPAHTPHTPTPRRVEPKVCLARPPAAPPRPRDPAAPRHAPGAHVRRCVPRRRTYAPWPDPKNLNHSCRKTCQ